MYIPQTQQYVRLLQYCDYRKPIQNRLNDWTSGSRKENRALWLGIPEILYIHVGCGVQLPFNRIVIRTPVWTRERRLSPPLPHLVTSIGCTISGTMLKGCSFNAATYINDISRSREHDKWNANHIVICRITRYSTLFLGYYIHVVLASSSLRLVCFFTVSLGMHCGLQDAL